MDITTISLAAVGLLLEKMYSSAIRISRSADESGFSAMTFRRSFFFRFAKDRQGNVAILVAISLPIIIGFCALGAEAGYWYYKNRQLSTVVDTAAYAGAVALSEGNSVPQISNVATDEAATNGFDSSNGNLAVYSPPISGNHKNINSVEVDANLQLKRLLSGIFLSGTVPVGARAVATATVATGPACVISLDPSASGALSLQGTPSISSTNCSLAVNSRSNNSINVGGSASISAPCVSSAGSFSMSGITTTQIGCSSGFQHAPPAVDPYASISNPSTSGPCVNSNGVVTTSSINPGHYCGGLSFKNQSVTLSPGVYVIDGGNLSFNANSTVNGAGVTFYIVNGGSVSFSSNSSTNLSAPTSGQYAGILFFGDRSATANTVNSFRGGASSTLTGALYFPTQTLEYAGSPNSSGCVQIVADMVNMVGTSGLSSACANSAGMADMLAPVGRTIALVE